MKNQIKPQTPKGASKSKVPPAKSRSISGGGGGIDDFTLTPYLISIQYKAKGKEENETLEVCRSCFEQWLGDTGRLDWVTDTTGYDGHHQQYAGSMITEDYWQYADYTQKTEDLKDFVIAEVKAQTELD